MTKRNVAGNLRILFVTQYFYPEQFSNNTVVEELLARGHAVDVMTAVPNYPKGAFYEGYGILKQRRGHYAGARIARIPVIPRGAGGGIQLALNYTSFVCSGLVAQFGYRGRDYDIVLCSAPSPLTLAIPGIAFAKRAGVPSLLWVQDLWPDTPVELLGLKSRILIGALTRICAWIYRNIDVQLVPSPAYDEPIRKLHPDALTHFFPNTITSDMKPCPTRRDLRQAMGIPDGDSVLAYAGNIGHAQNFDVIVDAVALTRDLPVTYLIIGDGRDRARIEGRVADSGLQDRFRFIGSVPSNEVPQHLSYADGTLLTLRQDPAFAPVIPYRMQTFLAYAKPMLVNASGEVARLVQQVGCGLVSPPGDAQSLARHIRTFVALPTEVRDRMGTSGRNFAVETFDRKVVMDRLIDLMQRLASQGAPKR